MEGYIPPSGLRVLVLSPVLSLFLSAVNCMGNFSILTGCSQPCGGGTQTELFMITIAVSNGGVPCNYSNGSTQSLACSTNPCRIFLFIPRPTEPVVGPSVWVHLSTGFENAAEKFHMQNQRLASESKVRFAGFGVPLEG